MADTSDNKPKVTPSDLHEEATRPSLGKVLPPEEAAQTIKEATPLESSSGMADLDTLKLLSEQTGLPYVNLATYEVDLNLTKLVPYHIANNYKIFPLKQETDGSILVALSDPMNINVLDELRLVLDTQVSGAIAKEEDIAEAINMFYGLGDDNLDAMVDKLHDENPEENIVNTGDQIDLTNLNEIDQDAPVKKYVNLLLLQAIKDRASDLHIEPFEDMLRIRYRIDGVLHEVASPPKHLHIGIQSRFKVMAGMDISERRLPQDGRIKLNLAGRQIDLRVSSLPTVWGESIVLRILDKSMMMMGLEQIGLLPEVHDKMKIIIEKPNGIILVTGPTGCGKTTTLYSALNEIYTPELKVITNEDPVEYEMEGVVQVNIREALGLTFSSCLRAILRQDPDVIMVGEIRDPTTAQISIQAALTGHLVLSTLHTNDAPSTITRLVDMEVEPFLLSSTLEGVLAQRLVRTICPNCREEYVPISQMLMEMNMTSEDAKQYTFYHGRGCEDCNYTGYKGRIGIYELLVIDDDIRNLILERASTGDLARKARANGMLSMREDGWQKVLAGITTLDEILRVTFGVEDAPPPKDDIIRDDLLESPVVANVPAAASSSLGDADFVQKEDDSSGEEADRAK